jgi:hypothetical protein
MPTDAVVKKCRDRLIPGRRQSGTNLNVPSCSSFGKAKAFDLYPRGVNMR